MIYVLVPAFNHGATVGLLLWKVRQVFTSFERDYRLCVVNDGSSDGSDEVLAPYARVLPLTLITHRKPQGYAASLEELLRLAVRSSDRPKRDVAVTVRADFGDPLESLPEFVRRIEGGADVAAADRRGAAIPLTERLVRRVLPALARPVFKVSGAEDIVGTPRAYRLITLSRLVREAGERPFLTGSPWAAEVELLVKVARFARRVESVPIGPGRSGGVRPIRSGLQALRAAWALRAQAAAGSGATPDSEPKSGEGGDRHGGPATRSEGRRRRRGRGRGRGRSRGPARPVRPSTAL